jgi:hypothetical protein
MSSGQVSDHQLKWDTSIFVSLAPGVRYRLRIRRPSDFMSFKAYIELALSEGEVNHLYYQSPPISFMAGTIKPTNEITDFENKLPW